MPQTASVLITISRFQLPRPFAFIHAQCPTKTNFISICKCVCSCASSTAHVCAIAAKIMELIEILHPIYFSFTVIGSKICVS